MASFFELNAAAQVGLNLQLFLACYDSSCIQVLSQLPPALDEEALDQQVVCVVEGLFVFC